MKEHLLEALRLGTPELAHSLFSQTLETASSQSEVDQLFQLAQEVHHLGFVEEASQYYQLLQTRYPSDELTLALAEAAADLGDGDTALDYLLSVTDESPYYVASLLAQADIYEFQGLPEVALYKLQQAKAYHPDEILIDYALAEHHYVTGDYAKAYVAYQQLQQQAESPLDDVMFAQRLSHSALAVGEVEEAVALLEAVDRDRLSVTSLFHLAFAYFHQGNYERALQTLLAVQAQEPTHEALPDYLYETYKHLGQTEQAIAVLEQAVQDNPYHAPYYLQLATHYRQIGHFAESEQYIMQALQLDPEDTRAHVQLAWIQLSQERYEDVVQYIARQRDNDIDDVTFDWILALAYQAEEQDEEAIQAFEHAFEAFADELAFLKDYIRYTLEIGRRDLTDKLIHLALSIDSQDDELVMWHHDLHDSF